MNGSLADGVDHWPGYLDRDSQRALLEIIREAVAEAQLFVPRMPAHWKVSTPE